MGVGYGMWNDSLDLGVSVTTGYMRPEFISDGAGTLSEDGKTLTIYKEIYKGQSADITVGIINASSIPIELEGNQMGINESTSYNISISIPEDEPEIQESSLVHEVETLDNQDLITVIQLEIDSIQKEIKSIFEEIERLENISENHKFEHKLQFVQGI